jgi:DNA polymerase-3 subunit delta'
MLTWNQIEGHGRIKQVLERALAHDRMHHALLLTGPAGIGKRTLALALTGILNCTRRDPSQVKDLCGECPSCRKLRQGFHPDVMVVEPEGTGTVKTIKIAQIREIQKAATTKPFEGRWRVVIIDDAHRMGDEASNALLKTLEEPMGQLRLILVTPQPQLLLGTILSRCQMLRFGALKQDVVERLLASKIAAGNYDPALIAVAAGYAEGSVGRALELLAGGLLEQRTELLEPLVALRAGHPKELLDLAENLSKQKETLGGQLDIVRVFLRDVMLVQVGTAADGLINRDMVGLVEQVARRVSLGQVLGLLEAVEQAQEQLQRHINPQMVMERLLRALCDAMQPTKTRAA